MTELERDPMTVTKAAAIVAATQEHHRLFEELLLRVSEMDGGAPLYDLLRPMYDFSLTLEGHMAAMRDRIRTLEAAARRTSK